MLQHFLVRVWFSTVVFISNNYDYFVVHKDYCIYSCMLQI